MYELDYRATLDLTLTRTLFGDLRKTFCGHRSLTSFLLRLFHMLKARLLCSVSNPRLSYRRIVLVTSE